MRKDRNTRKKGDVGRGEDKEEMQAEDFDGGGGDGCGRGRAAVASSSYDVISPEEEEEEEEVKEQQQEQRCCQVAEASVVAPSQAVPVVGVPNYPNCIKWSNENLLAVGAGHLVTILNPASMSGPRGFVPVAASPVFDFGTVNAEDLQAHSLFQICLARDPRPGVRSIDWSPSGLAQNGGSLLAICTTDSRVKVYRAPFCDFQSEWVEVIDLSEMVFNYCSDNYFREAELVAARLASEEETIPPPLKWGFRMKRKLTEDEEPQHRKVQKSRHYVTGKIFGGSEPAMSPDNSVVSLLQDVEGSQEVPVAHQHCGWISFEASLASIEKGSRVEVLEKNDDIQYWVSATVLEIMSGKVLVRFDQSQHGVEEGWISFQRAVNVNVTRDERGEEAEILVSVNRTGQVEGEQNTRIERPRIRPQLPIDTLDKYIIDGRGGEESLVNGEMVEAWLNERWQVGMVQEWHGSDVIVSFTPSAVNPIVEVNKLRVAPFWQEERWIWKAPKAVSDGTSAGSRFGREAARTATNGANFGQHMQSDSSDEPNVGHRDRHIQSQGREIPSVSVPTSSRLHVEQGNISLPAQNSPHQHLSQQDLTNDSKEKSFQRVYKRRGLQQDLKNCNTRPSRNKRLPSRLKDGESVTWRGGSDDFTNESNMLEDEDGGYKQKTNTQSAKRAKLGYDASDVGQIELPKGTATEQDGKGGKQNNPKIQSKGSDLKHNRISPHEYAARSEILTPLVLAWSSKFRQQGANKDGQCESFVLLGAGMKSGKVGLWRMGFPTSYAIDHANVPVPTSFLGFLDAHETWVTCISWASCCNFDLGKLNTNACSDGGGPAGDILLLSTGCVDGSVKLWAGLSGGLSGRPLEKHCVPFMLLGQAREMDYVRITALELFVPPRRSDTALLAIGKASGSVELWELKSSGVFQQICSHPVAHQQMVTGFCWTADGRCLYSCGQDSLKRWDFSQGQLLPLPFPDGSGLFSSTTASDVCGLEALESFFGVTLSPNGLALACVRGVASDLLDQMYQARSQKGMVQLFWLGNEHLKVKKADHVPMVDNSLSPKVISGPDKASWELHIIEALEDLQDPSRTLVLWDVIMALSSLKEKVGVELVLSILQNWLSSWMPGQGAAAAAALDFHGWSAGSFRKAIPKASCRRLQMLNVIYRRLFLADVKTEVLSVLSLDDQVKSSKSGNAEVELWKERMFLVEHHLRQRLVLVTLQRSAREGNGSHTKDIAQESLSDGMQLLVEWALDNETSVVPELATRLRESSLYMDLGKSSCPLECCILCDATVLFESPEIGICSGSDVKHRLPRCSVSMQVCPPVCLWHCGCCRRSAVKQAPSLFFSLSSGEVDEEEEAAAAMPNYDNHSDTFPSCPFCGILMHRLLPNFFLAPSLV